MKKVVVKTTERREFHISRQDDGTFLIQIVMGNNGQVIANPIFAREEVEKMRDGLSKLLEGDNDG